MHGGTISAHSQGPASGSEFVVRLPALPANLGVIPPARAHRRETVVSPPSRRILVVDDNVDAARSLARLLTKLYGQDVRVAHDGPQALLAAEEFLPEVVLLDIGLPGMDGYQVARQLRSDGCCAGSTIIAVSGYGQDEDRRRSREAGFNHHLVKPLDYDALTTLISQPG
jgi:CheY-like chemotaxis protein